MPTNTLRPLTTDADPPDALPEQLILALTRTLQQIRYGVIEIIIQDGKIVQLNKTEKIRF